MEGAENSKRLPSVRGEERIFLPTLLTIKFVGIAA
jgi:hypothetical protein